MTHLTPPPDVSVLIAAWNANSTLSRAIESVLAQTGVVCEVIVIDDASLDDTFATASRFAEEHDNVIALANSVNGGPAVARNLGLGSARGRYVTVLDSDDFLDPDRLQRLVALADASGTDVVADDLLRVEQTNLNGPRKRLLGEHKIGWQKLDFHAFIMGNLTTANGSRGEMGFLKPLVRRHFLVRHDLRYNEAMRLGEDYLLYAQLLGLGATFYLTDPLGYVAVMRSDSLSASHSTEDLGALVRADLALQEQFELTDSDTRALHQHLIDTKKRWQWMRLIDAVKSRDLGAALSCFSDAPQVSAFLVQQLAQQLVLRAGKKLGFRNE